MKLLINSSGAYLTGDDIADAVLDYGMALANEQRVDLVEVPYVVTDDHGAVGTVRLTVGWRADISATQHQGEHPELLDDALLLDLHTRTSTLSPSGDRPLTAEDISSLPEAEEF